MLPENVFQHVPRLFTENERLRVTPCRLLSCSSGVAGNDGSEEAPFVEAHFWRIDDCVSTPLCGNHHVYRDSGSFGAGQCLWLNGPRAVLPKCVWSTFVSAEVFSVLYFTQKFLSVSVLRHSVRRVLNRCVFQTVLLSCVRGAFVDSTGFDV